MGRMKERSADRLSTHLIPPQAYSYFGDSGYDPTKTQSSLSHTIAMALEAEQQSTVDGRLRNAAEVHHAKNEEYGPDYKLNGAMLLAFFPDGLHLKTADDFGRFMQFMTMAGKMKRYSANFHRGGHADSLLDLTIIAQLLAQLDLELEHD